MPTRRVKKACFFSIVLEFSIYSCVLLMSFAYHLSLPSTPLEGQHQEGDFNSLIHYYIPGAWISV